MNPSRREVLSTLTVCGTCAALGFCPTELFAQDAAKKPIDLGPLTDFPTDGIYDQFAKSKKLFVIRKGDKLYAASSLCTHKNAVLLKKEDGTLECPKHKSTYDAEGIINKGPAKSSLARFAIRIENGHVMVDLSKVFEERQWDDPAASATIEPTK
jgi:nitrite reductase/ring-hydroxylating ferredoxin subunit